jgi:CMP/dCMP kinase
MIITISGNPGSGKSTVAKILVKRLGYERIYAGGILRQIASEKGIFIEELMKEAETNTKIDEEVDVRVAAEARKYDQEGKDVIVEGRVQYYFIPESKKVYVFVDSKAGAERIWKDLQDKEANAARNQAIANSVDEVMEKSEGREKGDAERYIKLYGTDHRKKENYDFVVDTTNITAEQAADKVMEFILKE